MNEFLRLTERYEQYSCNWAKAAVHEMDISASLVPLKENVKAMEAEVAVNGGYGSVVIDGTNDKKRAAQLELALAQWPEYVAAAKAVRNAEYEIAKYQVEQRDAENVMRGCRLSIEYRTRWLERLAAAEGSKSADSKEYRYGI